MVLWIMFGASVFVGFYILQGGQAVHHRHHARHSAWAPTASFF
jgi:hypothetical protein